MAKICVGSVFSDAGELNQFWLDLQLQFLTGTTSNFTHNAVVIDSSDRAGMQAFRKKTKVLPFERTEVVLPKDEWPPKESRYHKQGLDALLNLFRERASRYQGFLFLDSDAFPIRKGWDDTLLKVLPRIAGGKELATALRFEHIEQRLHGSVLFCLPHVLQNMWFEPKDLKGGDLVGKQEKDLLLEPYQIQERDRVMVLLNSNQYKVHPLLCMIYYDMFYHHGCGSRPIGLRAINSYWRYVMDRDLHDADSLLDQLKEDPHAFISKLAGWNTRHYLK